MNATIITFSAFESVVALDLTDQQIMRIVEIKQQMSKDEYAGYSSYEQELYQQILDVIGNQRLQIKKWM